MNNHRDWLWCRVIAAISAAVACTVASGCTINVGTHAAPGPPKVSRADLQKEIADRVAQTGPPARSVSCPEDLIGEVGKSTHCAVTMSPTSSFEALVTVSSVEGGTVNYGFVPVVSKARLEASVARVLAPAPVDSVTCESGLEGRVGAVARCNVTANRAMLPRAIVVTSVTGFSVNFNVIPILTKELAASSLLLQLGKIGPRPESVSCADDLEGIVDNTVECTAVTDGRTQAFIVTVTDVTRGDITFRYTPKT